LWSVDLRLAVRPGHLFLVCASFLPFYLFHISYLLFFFLPHCLVFPVWVFPPPGVQKPEFLFPLPFLVTGQLTSLSLIQSCPPRRSLFWTFFVRPRLPSSVVVFAPPFWSLCFYPACFFRFHSFPRLPKLGFQPTGHSLYQTPLLAFISELKRLFLHADFQQSGSRTPPPCFIALTVSPATPPTCFLLCLVSSNP